MIYQILILLLLFSGIAEAKNLYVNNSGSPTCSDSTTYANNDASNPWCTLLRAVRGNTDGERATAAVPSQAAQAGDVVLVTSGTYNYAGATWYGGSWLSVLYDPVNSGTSGSWITFRAVGTVNLTGNVGTNTSGTFGSNTGQYIIWDGFTINESTSAWRNGMVNINVNNVTVQNCTIIGQYREFPSPDNHAGIMVHGPREGDYCTGEIDNITIRNNNVSGFIGSSGRNDAAIKFYCLGANILVEHNNIYSNITGIHAKNNYDDNSNIITRYNNFHDNSGEAISIMSFSDWNIYQNIMSNNDIGFNFYCSGTGGYVGSTKPSRVYVVNNTMYGNTHGIFLKGYCSTLDNNHIKNNLIIGSTNGVISDSTECATLEYIGTDDIYFNYNFWDISGTFVDNETTSDYDWAGWRSTFGQDANSSNSTNPLFANASGNDFRLCTASGTPHASCTGASPAINAGIDILDLDGDSSTTDAITMGAYITGSETIGVEGESTTRSNTSGGVLRGGTLR